MVEETPKIFEGPFRVAVTCVRVPVLRAHCESINLQFGRRVSLDEVNAVLAAAPGIRLVDDRLANRHPEPLLASGLDEILVGRVRLDQAAEIAARSRLHLGQISAIARARAHIHTHTTHHTPPVSSPVGRGGVRHRHVHRRRPAAQGRRAQRRSDRRAATRKVSDPTRSGRERDDEHAPCECPGCARPRSVRGASTRHPFCDRFVENSWNRFKFRVTWQRARLTRTRHHPVSVSHTPDRTPGRPATSLARCCATSPSSPRCP